MMQHTVWLFIALAGCCLHDFARAETPANCSYESIRGLWIFQEGPRGNKKNVNCSADYYYANVYSFQLEFPNMAVDDEGNVGHWTMIYNQGFEVVINNRRFFAFSYYSLNGADVTSHCEKTFPGWSHEDDVNPSDWACFTGLKYGIEKPAGENTYTRPDSDLLMSYYNTKKYEANFEFIEKINSAQSSWQAKHYEFLTGKTIGDIINMAGGRNSRSFNKPKPAPVTEEVVQLAASLPASFDWRSVDGMNYISPIRDQGECGSCYSFASMAMNEARIRIKTNNTQQPVFSPQDVIECSEYSQGCRGGFTYLISGKYAQDFGLVEESCNPYKGVEGSCSTDISCTRHYSTNYKFVGGFYGACNEPLMRVELVKNGPIALGFQYYDDFVNYAGGIYHHTGLKDTKNFHFNPFELTNHAVLLVGYGTSDDDEDFWIAKNSWGTSWGESGYFRIRRGKDECGFESIAVSSDPITQH